MWRRRVGVGQDHDLEVLGREAVDQRGGLVPVAHQDDRAVRCPACAGDGGAGQGGRVRLRRPRATASAEGRVVGDQDGLRGLVMLGLGEQVEGDEARVVGGRSARMTTSDGPAMESMPTRPKTWRLASAT